MPITRVLGAIAGSVVLAVCLVVVDAETQVVRVDYETFCKLDRTEQDQNVQRD
jgi:hypothetical protein